VQKFIQTKFITRFGEFTAFGTFWKRKFVIWRHRNLKIWKRSGKDSANHLNAKIVCLL